MSETEVAQPPVSRPPVSQPLIPPFLPRMIHRLALPIVLIWLGIVFITNTVAPQLEVVSKNHSVSQSPKDATSFQSMMRVGKTFNEFNSEAAWGGGAPLLRRDRQATRARQETRSAHPGFLE